MARAGARRAALPAANGAFVLGTYRGRWRRVVFALKRGDAGLAAAVATALARGLAGDSGGISGGISPSRSPGGPVAARWPRNAPPLPGWIVTWVPSPPERHVARGFVPAARVARALARRLELPARPLLRARVGAPHQTGLDRAARRRNARATFRAARSVTGGVVLVDDVITTGATADACAAALRTAGARRVVVVAVARTGSPAAPATPATATLSAPRRSDR